MAQDDYQQEINKGIQQMVKILSMGMSPADQKKTAEMEAETAKQEKANAEQKKSDSKKEGAYWSDNIKTWTQLGKFMTKGVKTWFAKQMKANTKFGMTLRMGANIWKNLNEHVIQNLKNAFGSITSHVKEVLGPVAEVFESLKNVFSGVFKFFKGTIMGIGAKVKPEDKMRNKLLQKMLKYLKPKDTAKAAFAASLGEKKEKPKGWAKFLLVLGMIMAAALGAAVRKFILPFEIAGKFISKPFIVFFKWLGKIGRMFKSLFGKSKFLTKFFGAIGKLFGWIGKAFKWVGGIVGKVIGFIGKIAPAAGGLAKLGRAFMYGFKILGWPLTIIMGIYDFIRGFIDTEGSLWDKVKGGLKNAIDGFIGMPIRFFSWIIETVMGWFGVEMSGTADKIMGFINGFVDWFVDMFQNLPLIAFITGFFSTEGTFMEKLKGGLDNMIQGLINMFASLWNGLVDIAYNLLPDWVVDATGIKKMKAPGQSDGGGGGGGEESVMDTIKKNRAAAAAAKKAEMDKAEATRLEQERLAKAQLEATKAAGTTTAAAVGGRGGAGGKGGDSIPQIPDEVDNMGMTVKNYDMEMVS